LHGPAVDPEPSAQAAEPADHAVGDEQDAVAGADFGDGRDVAGRWNADAAGTDDRLAEERGDAVRAEAQDLVLERLHVVLRHAGGVGDERSEALGVGGDPADARTTPWVPW
jgi:hypothetical protein